MKLVELDVLKFLDVVDSNSPAPGGGSVSALASSLGASLARMVAHLSFGKKNYEALADDVKAKFVANFDELLKIKNELNDLIDRDSEAYNTVMAAYKLPKETDEEKATRSAEIQKSLKYAIQTPYDIVVLSGKAISLLGEILAKKPEELLMLAVKRMLPKNKLGRQQLTRLRVFAGAEHSHVAQKPNKVEL